MHLWIEDVFGRIRFPSNRYEVKQFERMMFMKERKIMLAGADDAKEFVRAASKCDFDVDVFYNRVVIDAKSIMGVLSLDLTRELTVKYGGEDISFEAILDQYGTA